MRDLKIIQHITLDGVIQNTADENDFPYTDWGAAYRSPEGRDAVWAAHGETFDMLIGRRTYDSWASFYPQMTFPLADRINAGTKYVVTHHPDTLTWGPSEAIGPDLVEGVRRLKSEDGPDLVVCGSSTLTSTLLEHGLADEVWLITNPVLLGTGKRLFAEGTPAQTLELTDSKTFASGLILATYKPAGQLKPA
ncbi:dihydrofolate reductase family protein [Kribbella sp. NPDC056861]|uniref:dihydrofolate reductase family protein n=1 Tax=Kribbella sp. NPDC056861 TaxID=3154857 RepID=UPI00343D256C